MNTDHRPATNHSTNRTHTASSEVSRRVAGCTVALVGADGAGKTTVARRVADQLPIPSAYMYMGANLEAGNWMLPTTWAMRQWRRRQGTAGDGGGPPKRERASTSGNPVRHALRTVKSSLSIAHRVAEQAFRHVVAWTMRRTGRVVIFDRHYYTDYYSFDIDHTAERTVLQRMHGFLLEHVFPKPELVLFLDAPSEVLLARKGEGTIELLEHRRQDYERSAHQFAHFLRIDVSQPLDVVVQEVMDHILEFCRRHD